MDDLAGGHGVMVKTFIQAIDGEWSRAWGWRPHRPVTIYLYTSGYGLAQGLTQITGAVLSPADFERIAITNAVARGTDRNTGGWAILMNLDYRYREDNWESSVKSLLLNEYSHIFMEDLAGGAGPEWFRVGFAQWSSYNRVQDADSERSVVGYAAVYKRDGTLPTLMALAGSWAEVVGRSGGDAQAAYGASYLAVKYLANRVGGMPLLQALQRTAAGEPFDSALQEATGYSTQRLESDYRSSIPAP